MNRQEWEQDVRNRQRNIVFPDTVLNEGRFYRNLVHGKVVFSWGQKACLLVMVAYWTLFNVLGFASAFAMSDTEGGASARISTLGPLWGELFFWIFLTQKALSPPAPRERKRRGGYRTSRRG